MARYFMNILLTFLAALYLQSVLSINQRLFSEAFTLKDKTMNGKLNAEILDSRVTYYCHPSPRYQLSEAEED